MFESVVEFIRAKNKTGVFYNVGDQAQKSNPTMHQEPEEYYVDTDIDIRMNESLKKTDKKISLVMLYFSLSVLLSIIFYHHGTALRSSFSTLESIVRLVIGRLVVMSWFLVPLACGISVGSFTWLIAYKDSRIPGVDPPTPLSPSKRKVRFVPVNRGPSFHPNYVFAVAMGVLVFALMLFFRW